MVPPTLKTVVESNKDIDPKLAVVDDDEVNESEPEEIVENAVEKVDKKPFDPMLADQKH